VASKKKNRKSATEPLVLAVAFDLPKEENDDGETVRIINAHERRHTYKCGHEDSIYFEISVFGSVLGMKQESFQTDECGACTLKSTGLDTSIRCCMCGHPIMPGDGIALYSGFNKPDKQAWKTPYVMVANEKRWIGCLNMNCCPSGGFFGGHFTKDGIRSAFGGNVAAVEALQSGKLVIGNI